MIATDDVAPAVAAAEWRPELSGLGIMGALIDELVASYPVDGG